jgi:hypothetical protein
MIDERVSISSPIKRIRTFNGPHGLDMPNFEIINFTLQKFVGYLLNCSREHETYLTSKYHAAGYVLHWLRYPTTAGLPGSQMFLGKPLSSCYLEGTLSVSLSQGGSHDNPLAPSSALATDLSDVESAILQSQSTIQVSTR